MEAFDFAFGPMKEPELGGLQKLTLCRFHVKHGISCTAPCNHLPCSWSPAAIWLKGAPFVRQGFAAIRRVRRALEKRARAQSSCTSG